MRIGGNMVIEKIETSSQAKKLPFNIAPPDTHRADFQLGGYFFFANFNIFQKNTPPKHLLFLRIVKGSVFMASLSKSQKRKAYLLQMKGYGYRKISSAIGISENAAKYFCKMSQNEITVSACKNCGNNAVSYPGFKKKIFCSEKCRREWWSKNQSAINRKTKMFVCKNCGKKFISYRKVAVFCSKKCSGISRRKVVTK